ncbi:tetratricopeptide repeat protein [Streptomyces sp. NPDC102384]|uniref:tetratricopeptide repeat protein n=1 Tax=Streptomyces sp. NPDC102384 TaxID=3366166 RepID=UPI003802EB96
MVLSGGGGVGKSQIAAAHAQEALAEGTDLVLWADAGEPEQVVSVYAQAAFRIQVPGFQGNDAESDARAFLDWLATTTRPWFVVLDDVGDPSTMAPWWPPTPSTETGRVLATTRRRDATLSGGGRRVIDVVAFDRSEALAYMQDRLSAPDAAPLLDDQVVQLIEELGRLPLALSHAAAYVINEAVSCTEYLRRVTGQGAQLDVLLPHHADAEGYGRPVAAALLLSLDAANLTDPVGLAVPALRLAAFLDSAGHPRALWSTTAVARHLSGERHVGVPEPAPMLTAEAVHAALRLLHRYGLLTDEPDGDSSRVSMHALTARATRESIPDHELEGTVRAAADALCELWPDEDGYDPDLHTALRSNVESLRAGVGSPRWSTIVHPLLFVYGDSLLQAGLYSTALTYWCQLSANYRKVLGKRHLTTLAVRNKEATAHWRAGNITEAIATQEEVVRCYRRRRGAKHQRTVQALADLAIYYRHDGRQREAIALLNRILRKNRGLRSNKSDLLAIGNNLATAYWDVGLVEESIDLLEVVASQSADLHGEEGRFTLVSRSNLGTHYSHASRCDEAVVVLEPTVADLEEVLGAEHPDTCTARSGLATAYRQVGRLEEAIRCQEGVVDGYEACLGQHHVLTLQAQEMLVTFYGEVGRIDDAIKLQKQVISVYSESRKESPSEYLRSRGVLGVIYRQVGRADEAIEIHEEIVASAEEVFGRGQLPLSARGNLATAYWHVGRVGEAIVLEEQVAQECEQLLGVSDPQTVNAYRNLAISYMQTDRLAEAAEIIDRFGLTPD